MKKFLLCTSALVALSSSVMASEDVKVSFTGQSKFEVGIKSQDSNHKKAFDFSPNQKSSAFFTSQKASLKAEGKVDSLTYGAVLRLELVGNGSDGMGNARNDRSHIYVDSDFGSVQLGSNFAASKMMQVDASNIASATGGIDGDWSTYASTAPYQAGSKVKTEDLTKPAYSLSKGSVSNSAFLGNAVSSMVITSPNTLSNRMDSNSESARKITYMSPRISGAQLGLSFTPDFNNDGGNNTVTTKVNNGGFNYLYLGFPARIKNLWSAGLNYTNTFNDVAVSFSLVGDYGKAVKQDVNITVNNTTTNYSKFRDLKTFSVGGTVATNGFSFALSYHKDGNSLTPTNIGSFKSSWWTTGVAYENGQFSTSLTYLQGKKEAKDLNQSLKTSIVSLGVDYQVVPGLKPFAEVSLVNFKPKNNSSGTTLNGISYDSSKAKATVFIMGTKLKF